MPIRADEARAVVELLTTGEIVVDVVTGLRAVLVLVPRLPVSVARDVLTLPDLPHEVAQAIRADLKDNAPRTLRDVIVDLHDGKLNDRRRILTNTLRVLLAEATPGALVETIRALIGPENQTVRLAMIVYARTQGIDLDEEDLDALYRALDPDNPDLGVFLDRGLERVVDTYQDAARPGGLRPSPGHRAALGRVTRDHMTVRSPRCRPEAGHPPAQKEKRHMADHGARRRGILLCLSLTLLLARMREERGTSGRGPRRGRQGRAGRPPRSPRPTRTTSATWTAAAPSRPTEVTGAQHLDRVDGRERSLLGHDQRSTASARFDLLKIVSSHPDEPRALEPRQPLAVPRARQRAVLREADRSRSEALRPLARPPPRRLPGRSLRERAEVSGGAWRWALAASNIPPAPTTDTRPGSWASGCSRTRTSTRRPPRSGTR